MGRQSRSRQSGDRGCAGRAIVAPRQGGRSFAPGQGVGDRWTDDGRRNGETFRFRSSVVTFAVCPPPSVLRRLSSVVPKYSTPSRKRREPPPPSFPTASGAGRWFASALPRWLPDSSPPHSLGSAR